MKYMQIREGRLVCMLVWLVPLLKCYSGTPHNGHPSTTAICDIMANSPGPRSEKLTPLQQPLLYNSQNAIP